MSDFLSQKEKDLSYEYETKGYLIKDIQDKDSLLKIRKIFIQSIKKNIQVKSNFKKDSDILNFIHKKIKSNKLNNFRLKIINELAMQKRINLSIQLPNDKSSLLPLHSDVWSGDSPYEMVVWLPLVDCYKTKAMYILPPTKYKKLKRTFLDKRSTSSQKIFKKLKKDLKWIEIKYGQVLLFNQCLPHGNVVNKEKETRWSLNCRFKGVFTPYNDKKIGEFFEPISLRKISQLAIKYNLPKIK